jgi:acyl-CoA thioester hydrolase
MRSPRRGGASRTTSRLAVVQHEKTIEIRWRDVDAYRHVNNAVYATYLEECRDEWLEGRSATRATPSECDAAQAASLRQHRNRWFVLARVAIDFRQELRQEHEEVVVSCRLGRIGTSSLTLLEAIRTRDGELSAESEAVIVARDRENGGSRPLTDAERSAFENVHMRA